MWDRPIPFIQWNPETKQLQIEEEARKLLLSLQFRKIYVIGIVGPYRTGKSYILNRFLNKQRGFKTGATVNSCTSGIWLWGEPIQYKDKTILLIDSEGANSPEKDLNYDVKILTLTLLLTSTLLYNNLSVISSRIIEDFDIMLNISERIKGKEGNNNDEYYPSFYWILRDFFLELKDMNGKPISDNEYMENCLKILPNQRKNNNQIKDHIQKCFKRRKCFTVVRPVDDESKLADIESLDYSDLKIGFREKVDELISDVLNTVQPFRIKKTLNNNFNFNNENNNDFSNIIFNNNNNNNNIIDYDNQYKINEENEDDERNTISGEIFLQIAENYVNCLNGEELLNLQQTFQTICENETKKAINWATDLYHDLINSLIESRKKIYNNFVNDLPINNVVLPLEEDELYFCHDNAYLEANWLFNLYAKGDLSLINNFFSDFIELLGIFEEENIFKPKKGEFLQYYQENNERSRIFCERIRDHFHDQTKIHCDDQVYLLPHRLESIIPSAIHGNHLQKIKEMNEVIPAALDGVIKEIEIEINIKLENYHCYLRGPFKTKIITEMNDVANNLINELKIRLKIEMQKVLHKEITESSRHYSEDFLSYQMICEIQQEENSQALIDMRNEAKNYQEELLRMEMQRRNQSLRNLQQQMQYHNVNGQDRIILQQQIDSLTRANESTINDIQSRINNLN